MIDIPGSLRAEWERCSKVCSDAIYETVSGKGKTKERHSLVLHFCLLPFYLLPSTDNPHRSGYNSKLSPEPLERNRAIAASTLIEEAQAARVRTRPGRDTRGEVFIDLQGGRDVQRSLR